MDQKNGWSILTSDGATNWYVLKPGFILNSTTPADNDTLMYDSATNQWGPVAYPIPDADATTKGIVKLTNDFGGTAALPLVAKIQGVTSPAAAPIGDGYVMCSSSATQLVYSKITDGYVATNAAIAGTKINPNFGNQTATLMGLALTDYYLVNDTDIESDLNSMINIDSTDGYFYVQLPNPTTHPTQVIFIRDVGGMLSTNQVTIKRHGSELLNKLAYDKVLSANWGTWMFWNDGTDWYV
jgi:hypothetical protein